LQTDGRIGESAFLDCFNGAGVSAGAAANADIGIDYISVFALGDSLYGAVLSTAAALYASVSDVVSHDYPSIMCMMLHPM
jgi:hypothetical protein